MANKVNVDLDMNVQGYVDGMNQATESTAQYETETRKVQDSTVNLNKELRNAKREVQNLAAGYAKLDDEAKKSPFGQEMARQLQIAKEKAAEYIDLQGDLNTELKNMASDTATFDTFADGLSALGSTMSAVTGVMGIFTDDTELMTKAVTYFTTAESIASAAIKVKNLLQKQSALMLGITRMQQRAATAAVELDTAAKGKNAIATGAATVAQKAFNAVANANPYVLLATAVLGVVSAFALFSDGAEDATEAQNKLTLAEENGKKASESYANALASEYSRLMTSYTKLKAQWASLANDSQRKKFIEEHKNELKNLGLEVKNVTDAETVFQHDTSRIVEAFKTRARAAALAAKAAELYRQEMEIIEKATAWRDSSRYKAGERALYQGPVQIDTNTKYDSTPTYNNGKYYMDRGTLKYTEKGALEDMKQDLAFKQMDEAYKENQKQLKQTTDAYGELVKAGQLLSDSTNSVTTTIKNNSASIGKQITTYKEAIAEYDRLVDEQKQLQEMLNNGRVAPEAVDTFKEEIAGYDKKIQELVDKWHIVAKVDADTKPAQTKLEELESKLENAKNTFVIAIDAKENGQLEKQIALLYEFRKAAQELNDYKTQVNIGLNVDDKKLEELQAKFDAAQKAYSISVKVIPDKQLDKQLELLKKLQEAEKELNDYKAQIEIGVEVDDKKLEELQTKFDETQKAYDISINVIPDGQLSKQLELLEKLQDAEKELNDYKAQIDVKVNVEDAKLKELQENLENAEFEYEISLKEGDTKAIQNALEKIQAAEKELNDYKINMQIGLDVDNNKLEELKAKVAEAQEAYKISLEIDSNKAIQDALTNMRNVEKELSDYKIKINVDAAIQLDKSLSGDFTKSISNISDAISILEEELKNVDWSTMDPSKLKQMQKAVVDYKVELSQLEEQQQNALMTPMEKAVKHFEEVQEKAQNTADTFDSLSGVTGALGDIFKAAGDDMTASMMQVVTATLDMVAQIIPQIMSLIGAKQAEAMASGVAGAAKLPYPANLGAIASIVATVLSTFATIWSAINGAEKHAGGGIVGGNSYSGDKILARLNSGEMVLNQRQQKNLFNLLDSDAMPTGRGTNVTVTGIVRGTDLVLVQKNVQKTMKRAGNSINF